MKINKMVKPLSFCISLILINQAYAIGTGTVVGGSITFGEKIKDNTTIITQHSDRAIIEWDNFGISPGEIVEFKQPTSDSAVLNRIGGAFSTIIQGELKSNGQVFVVNPRGITITKGAEINVGSLILSSLNVANEDFIKPQNGLMVFEGDERGGIILNQGNIKAKNNIVLMGASGSNEGKITAPGINAGVGKKMILRVKGSSMSVEVDSEQLVKNGRIIYPGGRPDISLERQYRNTFINRGSMDATSIASNNGRIVLQAGHIKQFGTLKATEVNKISNEKTKLTDDAGSVILRAEQLDLGDGGLTEATEVAIYTKDTSIKGNIHSQHLILNSAGKVTQELGEHAAIKTASLQLNDAQYYPNTGEHLHQVGDYDLTNSHNDIRAVNAGMETSEFNKFELISRDIKARHQVRSFNLANSRTDKLLVAGLNADHSVNISHHGSLEAKKIKGEFVTLVTQFSMEGSDIESTKNTLLNSIKGNIELSGKVAAKDKLEMLALNGDVKSIYDYKNIHNVVSANEIDILSNKIDLESVNYGVRFSTSAKESKLNSLNSSVQGSSASFNDSNLLEIKNTLKEHWLIIRGNIKVLLCGHNCLIWQGLINWIRQIIFQR